MASNYIIPEKIKHLIDNNLNLIDLMASNNQTNDEYNIGVTTNKTPRELVEIAINSKANHFLQNNGPYWSEELLLSNLLFIKSKKSNTKKIIDYLRNNDFGKYQIKHSVDYQFTKKNDYRKIISSYKRLVKNLPENNNTTNLVPTVLNEFFTNAIFNAPLGTVDDWENIRLRNKNEIRYTDDKFGEISIGFGQEIIFIECTDPFGTIAKNSILKTMRQTYITDLSLNKEKNRGAGIGSRITMESSTTYGFIRKKKVFSTCFAIIPYKLSNKQLLDIPKNIHILMFD